MSKNLRTPSMTLPVRSDVGEHAEFCEQFARRMRCTMLLDVVRTSRIVRGESVEAAAEGEAERAELAFVDEMACAMRLEPLPDPSRYVIALELDRRKMYEHGVQLAEVRGAARQFLEERAEVTATEHSMEMERSWTRLICTLAERSARLQLAPRRRGCRRGGPLYEKLVEKLAALMKAQLSSD